MPEAKKERVRKPELVQSMNRLLNNNKIHIGQTSGAPSKTKKCLLPGVREEGVDPQTAYRG